MLRGVVIGRMDRRVQFFAPTTTYDSITNEPVNTYELSYECWAQRDLTSATENYESDQETSKDTITLYVRYNSSSALISPVHVLSDDGKQYRINTVQEDRRKGVVIITGTYKDKYESIALPYILPFTLT